MATVAGLVIGGISMAALVDGCMRTFDRIESARTYGRDYQKAALKLSLLQLRLSRWVESIIEAVNQQHLVTIGTSQEAEQVKDLLGEIAESIERTKRFADRYDGPTTPPPVSQDEKEIATMDSLAQKVKTLALHRQRHSSFAQKTRWALRDQRRFKKLLDNLTESISELETLFPATRLPGVVEARDQLAKTEASELIQPSENEEPGHAKIVVSILEDAATEVDDTLKKAVENADQNTRTGRHRYGGINVADSVRIQVGDYVAPGQRATGAGHLYGNLTATGTSRVQYGDNFGGKSVFDD